MRDEQIQISKHAKSEIKTQNYMKYLEGREIVIPTHSSSTQTYLKTDR